MKSAAIIFQFAGDERAGQGHAFITYTYITYTYVCAALNVLA